MIPRLLLNVLSAGQEVKEIKVNQVSKVRREIEDRQEPLSVSACSGASRCCSCNK